jgi:uncharacterized protein YjaG (DUF416 family)
MDKFREEIKSSLSTISSKGHVLFAVLICERLYPNYVAFQKTFNWGNHEVLQEAIALLRQYLIKEDLFEESEIEEIIERVDTITPHTEKFPGIITSFALDACTSVYSTLSYLLDKNVDNIADVASYARDTVDMYIQEIEDLKANDPKLEEKIAGNEFMILERRAQRELLKKLSVMNLEKVSDKLIDELRDKQVGINLELLPK